MNQRREPRFPTDRTVAVTVFGTPDTHLQGRIRNAAGRGLGLELATALATGTALKIELEDSILLGEVIYCRKQEKWLVRRRGTRPRAVRIGRVGRHHARIHRRTVTRRATRRRAIRSPPERLVTQTAGRSPRAAPLVRALNGDAITSACFPPCATYNNASSRFLVSMP